MVLHFLQQISSRLRRTRFCAAIFGGVGGRIENCLHRVMDVLFHDDLMRLRTEHGPANMATIRHAAFNLIRAIPDKASLEVRRKTLAGDDDYLLTAITKTTP